MVLFCVMYVNELINCVMLVGFVSDGVYNVYENVLLFFCDNSDIEVILW